MGWVAGAVFCWTAGAGGVAILVGVYNFFWETGRWRVLMRGGDQGRVKCSANGTFFTEPFLFISVFFLFFLFLSCWQTLVFYRLSFLLFFIVFIVFIIIVIVFLGANKRLYNSLLWLVRWLFRPLVGPSVPILLLPGISCPWFVIQLV
jgi:hypothetical protein